jgi:Flp pilus assembly protein TadG
MKPPALRRLPRTRPSRRRERGVTMVLVAIALVAIIAMAALSIDVITLYLAREEAQRSADAAALAAARVISLSGLTGDPNNSVTPSLWQLVCGVSPAGAATQTATAVANQSAVGGSAATVTVTYAAGGTTTPDCTTLAGGPFGVNPMVTVQLSRASLPTFFSRIWGNTGNTVSATATAEAFNPSDSGTQGNQTTGTIIPVQPRCVKPWMVPNQDPQNPSGCSTTSSTKCTAFVDRITGDINHKGISVNGGYTTGVIGERFWLVPDCRYAGGACNTRSNPVTANYPRQIPHIEPPPNLEYAPGQTLNSSVAVPSCSSGSSNYESAIAGCDQTTAYQCGVPSSSSSPQNMIDLSENPASSGDTTNGVTCLINEGDAGDAQPDGQDTLNPYGRPSSYPFQFLAGTSSPLVKAGLASGSPITSSPSIVSLPIFDDNGSSLTISKTGTTPVTIVGFLQVFINSVDQYGNVDVTVLNVAGCSNGTGATVGNPVVGSSPVPIRLITPE